MKNIVFLFLLISSFTFAQKAVEVDLSNPNATVYTHLYFLQPDSYVPTKAAKTIKGLPVLEAVEKAKKIKQVLDGKGLFVDFSKIPTNPNYNDTIGYVKSYKYVLFPDRMPEVSVEKSGDNWYYSKETVQNIDVLYNDVFPWYVQKAQKIIPNIGNKQFFGIQLWQLLMAVILIVLSFIIYFIFRTIAYFLLQKTQYRITKSKNEEVNTVLKN